MAKSKSFFLFIISLFFMFQFCPSASSLKHCDINAVYQFGDSISDTGNLIRESPFGQFTPFAHLPYGQTFFNRSTGRCSNGLLMIDFIVNGLGLPLLNPYLEKNASFSHGVNFAVAGSTALNSSFLAERNIFNPVTNSSLTVQLDWFKTHLKSICSSQTECKKILEKALFMVGEIGGNDYNYAFLQGKTILDARNLVHEVVRKIADVARELMDLGATRVIIPGNFPIGCMPIYLTTFKNNDTASYNEYNCLTDFNDFARFHNFILRKALRRLRVEYPQVEILYADYYSSFHSIFKNAASLGFEEESVEKSCCGSGGEYNFDMTKMCGTSGGVVQVCPNPERRISWDGIHLTQKAYEYMAIRLMLNLFPKLKCF